MWFSRPLTNPMGLLAPGIAFIRSTTATTSSLPTSAPKVESDSPFLS
eukprot:CAMPEP_0185794924 /NCGR_PEP_ID=MMETSP1174-20130828/160271_1 /TAXON_ID=35687 /ORGANISM="Dictyocha speculum, Strain CCMP1381" /LENGTH=46 /DNA_ID= /DNA_START= /DNA_END= /DNA_ORIENTATION=